MSTGRATDAAPRPEVASSRKVLGVTTGVTSQKATQSRLEGRGCVIRGGLGRGRAAGGLDGAAAAQFQSALGGNAGGNERGNGRPRSQGLGTAVVLHAAQVLDWLKSIRRPNASHVALPAIEPTTGWSHIHN